MVEGRWCGAGSLLEASQTESKLSLGMQEEHAAWPVWLVLSKTSGRKHLD